MADSVTTNNVGEGAPVERSHRSERRAKKERLEQEKVEAVKVETKAEPAINETVNETSPSGSRKRSPRVSCDSLSGLVIHVVL